MSLVSRLTSATALLLCLGTSLSAQDTFSLGFKFGGGPMGGAARSVTGNAAFSYSAGLELAQRLGNDSALVYGFGYRMFPGDFQNISFLPATLPTRAAIGTYYEETRVRKTDSGGFNLSAMYRHNAFMEGMYVQGGLIIGLNKTTTTDTGTRLTINVTTANTAGTIANVDTINSQTPTKTTSIGVMGGIGYRFGDRYSLELNLFQTSLEGVIGKKSGTAGELTFGVRF